MATTMDVEQLLGEISEGFPAGDDLRYTAFYEEIMEARRSEDAIALGDWQHDVKKSDWEKVITLSVAALTEKSKDLQIAVWLTEALTIVRGFEGLELGLRVTAGLVERFWDSLYPLSEEGDLEYRAAPFEFLNEKVAVQVRQVPLTEKTATRGYSWLKWQESREVGFEADTRNSYGDVDEDRRSRREERLTEGALTAEEFDAAAARSEGEFGQALLGTVGRCRDGVRVLAAAVGEKFGGEAPSLAELGVAVEACHGLVEKLYRRVPDQLGQLDPLDPVAPLDPLAQSGQSDPSEPSDPSAAPIWSEALAMAEAGQLQEALAMLLRSCNSSESTRDRNRIRLLIARLCLKVGRMDLARPILEELHGMIEELHLERWESPLWIAEVLDAYYQCLQAGDLPQDDLTLSRSLFRRICSLDVTKAMPYRN